jgi:hypothetical protein
MRAAFWLGAAVLALGLSTAAWAADPIGRISFGGSGGISGFALGDVNDRIQNAGNRFLEVTHQPPLRGLDRLSYGWTFWADVKMPVPMLRSFYLTGGYGVSSGGTQGPDVDNILTVDAKQTAYHMRLLYLVPFRLQQSTRLFVGGGPLFITSQKVIAKQENRSTLNEEWTEEIFYEGSGLGWQAGLVTEYMIQDHMTLALDLGYRSASLKYDTWTAQDNVTIRVPPTAESEEYNRLHYAESYPGHVFLNWDATVAAGSDDPLLEQFGPHREYLQPLTKDELGLDMSGMTLHIGLRFYFL